MTNLISQIKHRFLPISTGFLALALVWQCTFLTGAAIAAPLFDSQSSSSQVPNSQLVVAGLFNNTGKKVENATDKAKELGAKVGNRANQDLNNAGAAINQKGNEMVNKTKSNVDKLVNKVENSKENLVDKAGNAVEDTKNNIGDAANNAIENVKELFESK